MLRLRRALAPVVAGLGLVTAAVAAEPDWVQVERESTELLAEYIRIDTTNPPGNEKAAADFLAGRFRAEGLEARVFESLPGRGTILARLDGKGGGRPVVLLNHLDVVGADGKGWQHPPFDGVIEGGYVHGRGALDCKGVGVVEAMAMTVMKRAGITPARDVLFLGTADEETGGRQGAGWFVEKHFDLLDHPEFVLNEGGGIRRLPDGGVAYEVAVVEKTPLWLRLTTHGKAGHGSTPHAESAVTVLVRALDRIRRYEPPIRVVPEVREYYREAAALRDGAMAQKYRDIHAALEDPTFREEFLQSPRDAALVRNTISITVLEGSPKTNVVPAVAAAELDCRLLPGEDPDDFVGELRRVIDDERVEVEVMLNFPPSSSPTDTAMYRAIRRAAREHGAVLLPDVLRGFTDSHYFRERGVASYGFLPIPLAAEDEKGMHGTDERIPVAALGEGVRRLVGILRTLDAGGESPHGR